MLLEVPPFVRGQGFHLSRNSTCLEASLSRRFYCTYTVSELHRILGFTDSS